MKSATLPSLVKNPSDAVAQAEQQAQEMLDKLTHCVENHPGLCLAAAFGIGVTVAWLLKRM